METKILSHFDRELKRNFSPVVSVELNQKEIELILLLQAFPAAPMGFYVREIQLEKGSFTYLTDLLLQKGILLKDENPRDLRSKLLFLSPEGRLLATELRTQLDEYLRYRLSVYSEFEILQLEFAVEVVRNLIGKLAPNAFPGARGEDY